MLLWAGNIIAVKAAIVDVPPIAFSWMRFVGAFGAMLVVLKWREGSVTLPREDVMPLLILGLLGFGIYQDLWATGLGRTTAANSALITAATPVPTIIIAAAIGSDTLSRRKLLGAAIGLVGAVGVVVATHGLDLGGASLGDLMTAAATVCWALYIAYGTPVLARHSPLRTATWAIGFGTLGTLPFAVWQAGSIHWSSIHPWTLVLFAYCALLSAAAANVILFESVKVLGPARTTLFQFLVPAFAIAFAAFFLSEQIVIGQLVGGAVIVVGIMVSRSTPRGTVRRSLPRPTHLPPDAPRPEAS
jgi:drug/metabolite transporter (DMT)-like permease